MRPLEIEFVWRTDAPSECARLAASQRKNYPGQADNRTAAETPGGSAPTAAKTKRRPSPKQTIRPIGRMFLADTWTLQSQAPYRTPLQAKASTAIIRQTIHAAAIGLASL
jgi:hypothetical protein